MLTFMAIWGQRLLGFTLLGVACAALARWDWRFEWFSHWLPYFTVCLGVGLWCHRSKRVRLGLFVVILWLMASLYWALFSGNFLEMPVRDKAFRAIAMNVFLHNTNYQASETWLLAQQADVVILTEASSVWQSELSQLQRLMPYGCGKWEDSPFAMVLLAKQPLITCDMVTIDGLFPYVRAYWPIARWCTGFIRHPR
jgi:endonuclease/exonuclease/phosphatase (EEP) superfamily protein YafD